MARAFGVICGPLLASICFLSTLFAQTPSGLVEQFENTTVFWEQFVVAKKIVALHDKSVPTPRILPSLRGHAPQRQRRVHFRKPRR